jgi:hypothetical protein
VLDATPVVDLLPYLDAFLQNCHEEAAAGGKSAAAAKAQAEQLWEWLLQRKHLLHRAAKYLQQQACATPAAAAAPGTKSRHSLQPAYPQELLETPHPWL